MTKPRWWKRDLKTGKILVGDEFISRGYPITTTCFVRDWIKEGIWTVDLWAAGMDDWEWKSWYKRNKPFEYNVLSNKISNTLLIQNWRISKTL